MQVTATIARGEAECAYLQLLAEEKVTSITCCEVSYSVLP